MGNILPFTLQQQYLHHLDRINNDLYKDLNSAAMKRLHRTSRAFKLFPFVVWAVAVVYYFATGPDAAFRLHPLPATLIAMLVSWVLWNKVVGPPLSIRAQRLFDATHQIARSEIRDWWKTVSKILENANLGTLIAEADFEDIPPLSRAVINKDRTVGYVTPFIKNNAVWLVDQDGDLVTRPDVDDTSRFF